jgi:adenylylsulfate kinase
MLEEQGFAIWLTGLPASGKTTLALGLSQVLKERGIRVQILDSDQLRQVLTPEPNYSLEERDWFYLTMAYIGQLLTQNGVVVVFAATANRRQHRDRARQGIERFMEVYVRCSLDICMARDRKGIYDKALTGQASTVPGLQVPYEPPEAPELTVDTERQTPEESVGQIVVRLKELSWLAE